MGTLFRTVLVSERLPTKQGDYDTDVGLCVFNSHFKIFTIEHSMVQVMYWFETVELPSEEEILQKILTKQDKDQTQFMRGIDYILGFINNKK